MRLEGGSCADQVEGWLLRGGLFLAALFVGITSWSAADAQYIFKTLHYQYVVEPTGLYTSTVRAEVQASNTAAAAEIGQMPISFSESMDELDILEAFTRKADGRTLKVNTNAIFAQLRPGSPRIPMFDDMREKVIVFPNVTAGDSVVYEVRRKSKLPWFPNHFTMHMLFDRTAAYHDVRVTVRAPNSLPLRVETHDVAFEKEAQGDSTLYRWTYSNRNPLKEDPSVISPHDRVPRFFVSSFKSYDEFARVYTAMTADKIHVTPRIRELAAELTAGVTNKRTQVQRIYEWVSKNIRYVAIALRDGGVMPHEAEVALTNGYGDCKDHAVLFISLLKAVGIAGELALINMGDSYTLSDVPALAQINHAIVWIPEINLYADTTGGTIPFGSLSIQEYGKPVVHTNSSSPGGALRRTPVLGANDTALRVRTAARLNPDGSITGTTVSSATGTMSFFLRQYAAHIQTAGGERYARQRLMEMGHEGKGGFEFRAPEVLTPEYAVTSRFELERRLRLTTGDSFVPPPGLQLLMRPGEMLMGPLNAREIGNDQPTPCYSGRQSEEITLELPPGKRVARLPANTQVSNALIKYTARWSMVGRSLTVRRDFASTISQPLCTGANRAMAAAALREIQEDHRATISIIDGDTN